MDNRSKEIQTLLQEDNCAEMFVSRHQDYPDCTILLFDDTTITRNLHFGEMSAGSYFLTGLSNYQHINLLNSASIQLMQSDCEYAPCGLMGRAYFDSNAIGSLRELVLGSSSQESKHESLIEMLNKLLEMRFDTMPVLYMAEAAINEAVASNPRAIYDSLLGYAVVHHALEENLTIEVSSFQIVDRNKKNTAMSLYKSTQRFPEIMESGIVRFNAIRNILMKAIVLEHSEEKASEKAKKLVDFVNHELCISLVYELTICMQLFKRASSVQKFFGRVDSSAPRSLSLALKCVNSMAWDMFHLRLMSTWMAQENASPQLHVSLPFLLSADDGLRRLIDANPIKRIAFDRGEAYMLYEYRLEDFCNKELQEKLISGSDYRHQQAGRKNQEILYDLLVKDLSQVLAE